MVTVLVVLFNVACLMGIKLCGQVALIERYVDINNLVIYMMAGELVYAFFLFFILKRLSVSWDRKIFYGVMLSAIFVMLFLGYITHGESIRSLLLNDKIDGLMDFFNSVQYGKKPYERLVIYPPLINVIYGFLGRYMFISTLDTVSARSAQMGILVYGMYAIAVYSVLLHVIYTLKYGQKVEKILAKQGTRELLLLMQEILPMP